MAQTLQGSFSLYRGKWAVEITLLSSVHVSLGIYRNQFEFEKGEYPLLQYIDLYAGEGGTYNKRESTFESCIVGDVVTVLIDLEPVGLRGMPDISHESESQQPVEPKGMIHIYRNGRPLSTVIRALPALHTGESYSLAIHVQAGSAVLVGLILLLL